MPKRTYVSTLGMTFVLSNYGTFFQHYCLREVLKGYGYETRRWRYAVDEAPSTIGWIKMLLTHVLWRVRWIVRLPEGFENLKRELFLRDWQNLKFRKSYRKLIGSIPGCDDARDGDLCVLGSDQILGHSLTQWFTNAPDGVRRIIYAGSGDWGRLSNDVDWQERTRAELKRFAAISVREDIGVKLIQGLAPEGKQVFHAADPVLLLTKADFEKIASPKKIFKKRTLFCYLVNIRSDEELQLQKLEKVSKELDCELKILGVQGAMGRIPRRYRLILSPEEFLAAYRDAAYVITNSFHGSVFAIQFQKQFVCFKQIEEVGARQNLRQEELLSTDCLRKCLVDTDGSCDRVIAGLIEAIDWFDVDSLYAKWRENSLKYLQAAVSM